MALEEDFTCKQAFNFADDIIYKKTGEHLNTNEKQIFEAAWNGNKYSEMVDNYNLELETFRKYGSHLWRKLNNALENGEKINKKNFKVRLEMLYKQQLLETKSINDLSVSGDIANRQNQAIKNLELEVEYPDRQVPLGSNFYIERDVEKDCYDEILQPGALIRIKASRHTGKTSLIARILNHANHNNCKTLRIDLEAINQECLSNLDKFLLWFCAKVSKELKIDPQLDNWNEDKNFCGSNDCCTSYFEDHLLKHFDVPIILALDGLHKLFQYPEIYKDFFEILRYWHEEAKNSDIWKKLHIIVAYSTTEAFLKLKDNQSPFNVGYPVNLPDFNTIQIKRLIEIHNLNFTVNQIEQMEKMLGGHPYLTRLALYHIKNKDIDIESFLKNAATEGGIYSNHLRGHLQFLQEDVDLSSAFVKVITFSKDIQFDSMQVYKLQKMGLVLVNGDQVSPRCYLYCNYFRNRLKV
jgi:AAA-like domain